MQAKISRNHFSTEAEALSEIEAAGYFPMTIDIPATTNDDHWHDFETMLFILDGSLTVTESESNETYTLNPGDKAEAKSGVLHREAHDGFRGTFGFSVDPATFTMPIDKPPVDA